MVNIKFEDLIIENISDSSGVFSGDNIQVKWKAYAKDNNGFGTISGDLNRSMNNRSILIRSCKDNK